jgi:XRE family transcriptional regulator, master regulator for biofilm formation
MIGKRIRQLRQQKGYSISELANLADVSKSYLSQLERGLQNNPSLQFLVKLSTPLDSSIDYLLKDMKMPKRLNEELDEEWKELIRQAIEDGMKKEDLHEYCRYIKFKEWMSDQNNS